MISIEYGYMRLVLHHAWHMAEWLSQWTPGSITKYAHIVLYAQYLAAISLMFGGKGFQFSFINTSTMWLP